MKYYDEETITAKNVNDFTYVESEFVDCAFEGIDFQNQELKKSKFIECQFILCNLSNVKVSFSTFREVSFIESKMVGVNWTTTQAVSDLSFDQCKLDDSVFLALKLNGIKFTKCSLINCDFSESQLMKSSFKGSDLKLAQFNNADLESADLTNCLNYYINPLFTKLKKAKFSFPEAISLLEAQEIKVQYSEKDLI